MSVRGTAFASATLENETATSINAYLAVGMGLFTHTDPFRPELPYLGEASPIDNEVWLDADDGVAGSGPDFFDFGRRIALVDDAYAFSEYPGLQPLWSEFTGVEPFTLTMVISGGWAHSGGTVSVVTEFAMQGEFTLTYEFEPVPAPGTAMMTLMALGALARRHR